MNPNDTPRVQQQGREIEVKSEVGSPEIQPLQGEKKAGRKKIEIRQGQTFGRLTSLHSCLNKNGHQFWMFRCACGVEKIIRVVHVLNGKVVSCSCEQGQRASDNFKTHGMTESPEYATWTRIKTRCYNPRDISYHNYGGRGIFVCERWLNSFSNFLSDLGLRPSNSHSIERMDYNGPYSPDNCIWATKLSQANNTRKNRLLTFAGKTLTISQWSRETGIQSRTLLYRLKHRWTNEKILTTPAKIHI